MIAARKIVGELIERHLYSDGPVAVKYGRMRMIEVIIDAWIAIIACGVIVVIIVESDVFDETVKVLENPWQWIERNPQLLLKDSSSKKFYEKYYIMAEFSWKFFYRKLNKFKSTDVRNFQFSLFYFYLW